MYADPLTTGKDTRKQSPNPTRYMRMVIAALDALDFARLVETFGIQ
ncbi:MAG TPA: hypothetical protein VEL12_15615 [Candidatus Nitrosopolaris sp.]|nr:hypothetical protein [Candidatus Nitrosopolaris sp.]